MGAWHQGPFETACHLPGCELTNAVPEMSRRQTLGSSGFLFTSHCTPTTRLPSEKQHQHELCYSVSALTPPCRLCDISWRSVSLSTLYFKLSKAKVFIQTESCLLLGGEGRKQAGQCGL